MEIFNSFLLEAPYNCDRVEIDLISFMCEEYPAIINEDKIPSHLRKCPDCAKLFKALLFFKNASIFEGEGPSEKVFALSAINDGHVGLDN